MFTFTLPRKGAYLGHVFIKHQGRLISNLLRRRGSSFLCSKMVEFCFQYEGICFGGSIVKRIEIAYNEKGRSRISLEMLSGSSVLPFPSFLKLVLKTFLEKLWAIVAIPIPIFL